MGACRGSLRDGAPIFVVRGIFVKTKVEFFDGIRELIAGARTTVARGVDLDATRRGVLEQLGRADASITALAERFHMTLTGMKKHVGVLEQAGVVRTEKVGRVRTCRLGLRGLEEEAAWIRSTASCGPRASTSWTLLSTN